MSIEHTLLRLLYDRPLPVFELRRKLGPLRVLASIPRVSLHGLLEDLEKLGWIRSQLHQTRSGPLRVYALTDRVWTQLGLRLSVMDSAEFQRLGTRYRGGLTVLDVRSGSPAAQQGIRRGDVLVGMHVWETISLENMAYILDREDLDRLDPVVFYIVRGSDTLYGHMQLAKRTVP